MVNTKEHQDLVNQFEKEFKGIGRLDKEAKEFWPKGNVYQDGHLNNVFLAYRKGYALGKCIGREEVAA